MWYLMMTLGTSAVRCMMKALSQIVIKRIRAPRFNVQMALLILDSLALQVR